MKHLGNSFTLRVYLSDNNNNMEPFHYNARGIIAGINNFDEVNVKDKCINNDKSCILNISAQMVFNQDSTCSLEIRFKKKSEIFISESLYIDKVFIANIPSKCELKILSIDVKAEIQKPIQNLIQYFKLENAPLFSKKINETTPALSLVLSKLNIQDVQILKISFPV